MTSDFIETRCARSKKNHHENFVSVEYITYKKKVPSNKNAEIAGKTTNKTNNEEDHDRNVDPKKQQELAMKRARYEVIKFGMSGLGNAQAQKAKIETAIALGARPPKNRRQNYKVLKAGKLKTKATALKKQRLSGADNSLVKPKKRRKPRRKDDGILGIYGKVKKGPDGK